MARLNKLSGVPRAQKQNQNSNLFSFFLISSSQSACFELGKATEKRGGSRNNNRGNETRNTRIFETRKLGEERSKTKLVNIKNPISVYLTKVLSLTFLPKMIQ